jgi:serine/threonine-protein kinase
VRRSERAARGAKVGYINVYAEPWANVIVDGKSVGTTPIMKLALPEGTHRVRLQNPHARPQENVVRVQGGQTQLLNVDLLPLPPR